MNAPVRVYREVEGPSAAPTVVLSGSLGSDLSMWEPQVTLLARDFRVIRYDHRGHGRSPIPNGPYALADLGADVIAMLDDLGLERIHFCGLSLGGMVGLWLAVNNPERVDRLVLFCTSAALNAEAGWRERASAVRTEGMQAVASAVVERWFTLSYALAYPELMRSMERMVRRTPAEGYASCCEAIASMDLRMELPFVSAPTLAAGAAEDPAIPPEHSYAIGELMPDCRVEIIESAAHLATYEQPDATTSLIVEHLSLSR